MMEVAGYKEAHEPGANIIKNHGVGRMGQWGWIRFYINMVRKHKVLRTCLVLVFLLKGRESYDWQL